VPARRSARSLVLVVVLLASLASCSEPPRPTGVVVVLIDTLRADHLSSYGYPRPTSPVLDALAEEGTRFENAIAPSPWTLPSTATLMTGLYPSVHQAIWHSDTGEWLNTPEAFRPASVLSNSHRTLAELLQQSGFATAAFVRGSYPSAVFGFGQGFDHFADNEAPGVRFHVEDALGWLDRETPERFFLYLHTVEVHSPYTPVELPAYIARNNPDERLDYYRAEIEEEIVRYKGIDFNSGYDGAVDGSLEALNALKRKGRLSESDLEQLIALYDRGIAYTDYWIGELLDGLRERGLYEQTLVIVTSDHGEEFMDHGALEHSRTFFEEMVRVPLIIRVPGEAAGVVVAQQVGLVDVLPTVLDVLGVADEVPRQGRSLRPLWQGRSLDAHSELGEASAIPGVDALRTNHRKFVRGPRGQQALYDLDTDPGERINLCQVDDAPCRPFFTELMARKLENQLRLERLGTPDPATAELDDDTREQLRALGYAED